MSGIRAVVKNGRFVIDEPTDLPDGTVIDLVVDDEGDELCDEERAALHAALERSMEQLKAGNVASAGQVVDELRTRK